ncbi:MAG TPA: HPP family protein [Novosphingobium sp.]
MPYRLLVRAASHAGGRLGWARSAVGALLGILSAILVTDMVLGTNRAALPWLVAPVGASAVLVFALPASPLAQLWPVLGGSMISAMIGLAVGHLVPYPPLASALAVGSAIAVMSALRCLHPPAGACALIGAMGAPLITAVGWPTFLLALWLDLVALLGMAWVFNNMTGHSWPHEAAAIAPLPPQHWMGRYDTADLEAVLEDWEEVLDVSRDDLDALFRAVEEQTYQRVNAGLETRNR